VALVSLTPAVGVPVPSEAPDAPDDVEKPAALLQLALIKDFVTSTELIVAVESCPIPELPCIDIVI